MNDGAPLFSIVIVNFNNGIYLENAIISILNQDFIDFELIIIDGGSQDNSLEILLKYDKYIRWWVSESDSGQSEAFNKGFNKATGKYYFWLNADDILLKNSLSTAKIYIENNPNYLWFSANTIFFNENGTILKCTVGPKWNKLIMSHSHIYVYGPSSIFHRDLFSESQKFNESLHYTMDTDLWLKFINLGYKFYKIDIFFWGFRIHSNSKTSHAFFEKKNKDFQREFENVYIDNNHKVYKIYNLLSKLQKYITGCYIKSLYYTFKYKGKNINLF